MPISTVILLIWWSMWNCKNQITFYFWECVSYAITNLWLVFHDRNCFSSCFHHKIIANRSCVNWKKNHKHTHSFHIDWKAREFKNAAITFEFCSNALKINLNTKFKHVICSIGSRYRRFIQKQLNSTFQILFG